MDVIEFFQSNSVLESTLNIKFYQSLFYELQLLQIRVHHYLTQFRPSDVTLTYASLFLDSITLNYQSIDSLSKHIMSNQLDIDLLDGNDAIQLTHLLIEFLQLIDSRVSRIQYNSKEMFFICYDKYAWNKLEPELKYHYGLINSYLSGISSLKDFKISYPEQIKIMRFNNYSR